MYAGVKWTDLEDDPEAYARAYTKCWAEIPIDLGSASNRISLRPAQALGNNRFVYTSDGMGVVHDQASDVYFGPEVYDEILTDQAGLMDRYSRTYNTALTLPRAEAVAAVREAAKAQLKVSEITARISSIMTDEMGVYNWRSGGGYNYTSEFWTFYDSLRGAQMGLSDLRRYPDKVKAACDFLFERTKARVVYDQETMKQQLPPASSMFHPEPYLSPQQFDELYFSRFMEILGPVMEAGKKVFLYGEGAFIHHIDRFRETPKGSMIIVLDQDDPFETAKKVGDWCTLVAGPKAELLQLGTQQQIKDFVKRLFDELAPGGGFIFGLGNGLVTAKDSPIESIVTAYETAYELNRGGNA
jgi:hypothetical protein